MEKNNLDPENFVHRMRILTGDYSQDEPFLEDSIYVWLYGKNGNSEIDGAIEALESIINNIALTPSRWRVGEAEEWSASVQVLEARLKDLRSRKAGRKVPVILSSDRKNWKDFNKLFG